LRPGGGGRRWCKDPRIRRGSGTPRTGAGPFPVAEGHVVLGGILPLAATLDHEIRPAMRCWRSMLSNSARKLPAPKPFEPLRWMISKEETDRPPDRGGGWAASLRKICSRYWCAASPSTRISRSRKVARSSSMRPDAQALEAGGQKIVVAAGRGHELHAPGRAARARSRWTSGTAQRGGAWIPSPRNSSAKDVDLRRL